ncbi:hypothetical protein KFE25_013669 [Diacronema lutheri]|uniref:Uncharacterized protein n=1 Tax=Diacronema lutheri TaxID=2081491 RepID=A0A8J5XTE7_DIALT|nr:hypothetical protein KFE25_013669 [Diacronema lutheri]
MFAVALVLAAPTPSASGAAFDAFKATFGKSYASREEPLRVAHFEQTLREIDAVNRAALGWTAGVNEFADLSWAEFKRDVLMLPQNCSATRRAGRTTHASRLAAPPAIDWRDYGALNAVKNQRSCGSCWTFSTSGCLESHVFLKTGHMPNISEQQLVDCAGAFHNNGCNGGLPSQAFEYIISAGGIDSEAAYPYTAKTGDTCLYKAGAAGVVAKVRDVVNITEKDEAELEYAVGTIGPVSIAFEVAEDFRLYKSGVYDGVCHDDSQHVNHAVVAVGYGATEDGAPYWTVRNSWGVGWGERGHFRIARGANKCGLADCASYPIVA